MEKISDSEWMVMEVLWQHPNSLSADIVRLLAHTDWQGKTIKTLLNRLVKKGVVGYDVEGKSYRYYPTVDKEACVKKESRDFVKKFFRGSKLDFMASFIKDEQLSKKDIQQLRELLDKKDK